MTEYEKRWLTKWMRIGHYSRARYGGMIAIADPKVVASKLADPAKYVHKLKIFKYNDYTLWKLWHYVRRARRWRPYSRQRSAATSSASR